MSATPDSVVVRVSDGTGVGQARRVTRRAAEALGLGELVAEEAAIVATEASRNVLLHGSGGEVVVTPGADGGSLDILALDSGPGIPDPARAMRDGYSTRGTAGQGLGAMSRIASTFEIYSLPGKGTAVFARVGRERAHHAVEIGAISAALPTEAECGDGWAVEAPAGRPVILVADGLGHGPRAAEAARAAVAALRKAPGLPAGRIVELVHHALRPTRGAAVAVAELTPVGDTVRYAGIGNISGVVASATGMRKMVSLSGTAGHAVRTVRSFEYEWPEGALLVMHSDGVAGHWDLAQYPGLALRHPALVAGVLYRDFARGRDDATVVVARRHAR